MSFRHYDADSMMWKLVSILMTLSLQIFVSDVIWNLCSQSTALCRKWTFSIACLLVYSVVLIYNIRILVLKHALLHAVIYKATPIHTQAYSKQLRACNSWLSVINVLHVSGLVHLTTALYQPKLWSLSFFSLLPALSWLLRKNHNVAVSQIR